MNLVRDAEAIIAMDRDDRRVAGLIELRRRAGASLVTVAPVVAQVWRGGARQRRLARSLPWWTSVARTWHRRAADELLAASGSSDAVDALLALVAAPGDQLLTSDPSDLRALLAHRADPVSMVRGKTLTLHDATRSGQR